METKVFKDIRGNWQAQTEVPFSGDLFIRVYTMKRYDGSIVTSVTGNTRTAYGFVHSCPGDFSKLAISSGGRCTEKKVKEQQAAALTQLPAILNEVTAFYAGRV